MSAKTGSVSVAFVCAMPMELRPVVKRLSLGKTEIGGLAVRSGTLAGREVVAIVTGMGTSLAGQATTALLDAVTVERVVVVGITGAVDDDTPLGTLIRPEVVVDSATGDEHSPDPLGTAQQKGIMWTTDALLTQPEVLADLRARGVVSLDMETAAVAAACEERGVPWSVFRVISDRATDGSVDHEVFQLANQDGSPNGRAIARFFLKHPGRLPAMARMGRAAKVAAETAAEAAIDACRRIN